MPDFRAWGIDEKYRDDSGNWHDVSEETRARFLAAMEASQEGPPDPALMVIRQGTERSVAEYSELRLEDGTSLQVADKLPADLPLGYHSIFDEHGRASRLIVTPPRCFLPPDLHTWGWGLQLYALRSRSSWGIGDLADLRRMCKWAEELGAGIVMVNPLCATAPVLPQQCSPYFPSSRLFLNPLYLSIADVAGVREAIPNLEKFSEEGRTLNQHPLIERDGIFRLKMRALETIWPQVRDKISLDDYERAQGRSLELFATFCVLAEQHGANWRVWPQQYRRPDDAAVSELSERFADRIRFHKWLQFLLSEQLECASSSGNIMHDLPVGVAPDGADAWMWQDVFAKDVSVGAPPDLFNANGQDWGLPPFVPHKLRAAGYEPFIQTLRASLRYARGLRIDHVMGLFRLFWIPVGERSAKGTYVRYNADEMLSILALESARAKTLVVGEDLGTVDEGVREKLADYAVLSYRLLWFEETPPEHYPKLAVAAVSTHDLPTIAGIWSGADFAEQTELGLQPSRENSDKMRHYLQRATHAHGDADTSDVIVKTHQALARSPAMITLASMEDGLGADKRPNLPGAKNDQRPNWCIPLPKMLEEIETDSTVLRIAECLRR
ncbi:MAG TPA: 4-alpha-glucanotransferase [Candidatus Acidoferrum sp.]